MDDKYKQELLESALEARIKEVTEYQVNIDSFKLAIESIEDDSDMQEFKTQLQDLLRSSVFEQRKAKTMLSAIQRQMEKV